MKNRERKGLNPLFLLSPLFILNSSFSIRHSRLPFVIIQDLDVGLELFVIGIPDFHFHPN